MEANHGFFLFVIWCFRLAVEGQHEEREREDVQDEDGSQISSNLPPVEKDPIQFGDNHAGIIIHSVSVGCG